MGSKFQVTGKHKGETKVRQFHCYADAADFAESCKWDDVWIERVDSVGGMEKPDMYSRAVKASALHLERLGYEILERDWSSGKSTFGVIARDDAAIVFVDVDVCENGLDFGNAKVSDWKRGLWERGAVAYLSGYEECDLAVRFDVMRFIVVSDNRAVMRHVVNAAGL